MTIRNTGQTSMGDFLDHITLDLTNPMVPAVRCQHCHDLKVIETNLPRGNYPADWMTPEDVTMGRRKSDPTATIIRFVEAIEAFQESHRECDPQ